MSINVRGIGLVLVLAIASTTAAGCGYSGIATVGDQVVITRNDGILFGLLRKVYVCDVTPMGVTNCQSSSAP
jgi:hypothetical protein